MLSRVAASLYNLGRDLERAEHTARVLEKHVALWLDRASAPSPDLWNSVLEVLGWGAGRTISGRRAIDLIVKDPDGPSIRESMSRARRGAQAVRPSLSTEVFEQLNDLYWRLEETESGNDVQGMLTEVQLGVSLVDGLIEESMSHDEPWDFLRLGKFLERGRNVNRLVTQKMRTLAKSTDEQGEWAVVLRSCSAFEAYRWRFSAPVTPQRVTAFLLLDRRLPRSARYCVREALTSVARIDGPGHRSRPHRLLGQLAGIFEYTEESEVTDDPAAFATSFERLSHSINESLSTTYFQPSKLAAQAEPVTAVWAWSQQSQQ